MYSQARAQSAIFLSKCKTPTGNKYMAQPVPTMPCNCISKWKKTLGNTGWIYHRWRNPFGGLLIFLSCYPSNGIEQGKGIEKGGVLELRVLWGSYTGLYCVFSFAYCMLTFFPIQPTNTFRWPNTQDSRGSWAIYRTLSGPDCACEMGSLDGASTKWKWGVVPSIPLQRAFELRHLLSKRCTVREPRQVCLNCAGLWLWVVWVFRTVEISMDQFSKSRTKNHLQAKYFSPQMPLAARHFYFCRGSKTQIPINFTVRPSHVQGKHPDLQKAWFVEVWPYVCEKESTTKRTGWIEAWWMNFSFWLSIYHSWFAWEYGWIRLPCIYIGLKFTDSKSKVPKPNTKTTPKGMCLKRQAVPLRGKKTACSPCRPNMRVADCATVWACNCLQLIYLSVFHLILFDSYHLYYDLCNKLFQSNKPFLEV